MENLFVNVQNQAKSNIFLIDASGSTKNDYTQGKSIFNGMYEEVCRICKRDKNEYFRVIYWNSPQIQGGNFQTGIFSIPFQQNLEEFKKNSAFAFMNVHTMCLTHT